MLVKGDFCGSAFRRHLRVLGGFLFSIQHARDRLPKPLVVLFCSLLTFIFSGGTFGSESLWVFSSEPQQLSTNESLARFSFSYLSSSEKFSPTGSRTPLGSRWNRKLSWDDYITAQNQMDPDKFERHEGMKRGLRRKGISPKETLAYEDTQVETQYQVFLGQWLYGLSDYWSVGFNLPLIHTQTKSKRQTRLSQKTKDLMQAEKGSFSEEDVSAFRAGEAFDFTSQSAGIEQPGETSELEVGDVELVSRTRVWHKFDQSISLIQTLTLPTSPGPKLYRGTQTSLSDGQTDFDLSALWEWKPWPFTASALIGYTVQMPDSTRMLIPQSEGPMSHLEENNLKRDLGDIITARVGGEYKFLSRVKLIAQYLFKTKLKDSYSGSSHPSKVYSDFEQGSQQELHLGQVGVFFSHGWFEENIHTFRELNAQILYRRPLTGKNVLVEDTTSLELSLLF